MLGRLRPDAFLGGNMSLDIEAARNAIKPIAETLNLPIEEAANGIISIANEHMAHALRVMSVQRGIDPRDLTLASFGGAGGLHVCALAEALNMKQAMVPINAGVLSAMGMLVAPRSRQLSRSIIGLINEIGEERIEEEFDQLAEQGFAALIEEGIRAQQIETEYSLDLRYLGQSYYLNLPWTNIESDKQAFHELHKSRYGHSLDLPVELVNVRAAFKSQPEPLQLNIPSNSQQAKSYVATALYGMEDDVPVYHRNELAATQTVKGPALITETVSSTYLASGWYAEVDKMGNLLLSNE